MPCVPIGNFRSGVLFSLVFTLDTMEVQPWLMAHHICPSALKTLADVAADFQPGLVNVVGLTNAVGHQLQSPEVPRLKGHPPLMRQQHLRVKKYLPSIMF